MGKWLFSLFQGSCHVCVMIGFVNEYTIGWCDYVELDCALLIHSLAIHIPIQWLVAWYLCVGLLRVCCVLVEHSYQI
jgi:hypothetical protein